MKITANITLAAVTKQYGKAIAVEAIDLAVEPGECLALVGHNGAGKSTLIKMVLGLISPTTGTVTVMGHDPLDSAFTAVRKTIGFLPEQVLFQNNMTGRETLDFYARLKGASLDSLDELFHRVDLSAAADNRISTYSKGMRQRLGLAQALIGNPELLILDEPTSGLDPVSRQNVYSIINDMKKAGATILISSHALTELDSRIDRVAVLNRGKLSALGTIAELRRSIGLSSEIIVHAPAESLKVLSRNFAKDGENNCVVNGVVHLSCPAEEKIAVLKKLMDLNIPLADITITDPSLEQVFLALSHHKEPADE